ncbi:PepSY-associated TM helix domain-containing protein [Sinobacterium caligoides]|uniref:PepSY-associated TM helix domain-containing protein n=1 Tax=Sinobacterium caligoides TaxID=933926 RepID=UPI0011CE2C89|nr:PepSY-associated TM helix domain-containing protein [Sinobacterium caligoides]
MNLSLPSNTIKQSLQAHSILAIAVAVVMYWLCLTGALAVFADHLQRWEAPQVAEFHDYDARTIDTAVTGFIERVGADTDASKLPEQLYVVFPTEAMPRMHVSGEIAGEEYEWYLDSAGEPVHSVADGWAIMLRHLHGSLHLPEMLGVIIVSIFGVMLLALIVSGVLAHPKIFKDAFRLRLGGSRRMESVDLHNRLSVWGLPFHLMIAITGAYFGLVSLLIVAGSAAHYDGDRQAMMDDFFGKDPVFDQRVVALDFDNALSNLHREVPEAEPLYVVIHQLGSRGQFFEVAATLPGRLVYSELYRFAADGSYIGPQGLADGPAGRQAAYSVYRLHFGAFGPIWVKWGFLLLGLALTYICVSGIQIWLIRRNRNDIVDHSWVGAVWGTPLALIVSLGASIWLPEKVLWVFLGVLLVAVLAAVRRRDVTRSRRNLQRLCAIYCWATVAAYYARYGVSDSTPVTVVVSSCLMLSGFAFAWLGRHSLPRKVLAPEPANEPA